MKIIACVDDRMGLMFHQRRLSQDRIVRERINEFQGPIYMNEYSYQLYKDIVKDIIIDNHFLVNAHQNYCLIENVSVKEYVFQIEEIHLFKWNRRYPADFYLDIDFECYQLISQEEFVGSSHEKITYEIWRHQ